MSEEIGLYYIGKGASLDNIPARDLTLEEIARFDAAALAALIASGLYGASAPAVIAEKREAEAQVAAHTDQKVAQPSKRTRRAIAQ